MRESHFLSPPETILSIATATIRATDCLRWFYALQKQYAFIFRADSYMCSFKSLTLKFDFDIIKIEHRFLSSIVCLFNYNSGASYALFQYLFLIIPHFSMMREKCTIKKSSPMIIKRRLRIWKLSSAFCWTGNPFGLVVFFFLGGLNATAPLNIYKLA